MSTDSIFQTIVVGGGQAGLAAGYFLTQRGVHFTILDENRRTGEAWRKRWESLRLFTPSKYDGLPGKHFPGPDFYYPTKDEVAAYLEQYAQQFSLPIRSNVKVEALIRSEQGYEVATHAGTFYAQNVIVATGPYQKPFTRLSQQTLTLR